MSIIPTVDFIQTPNIPDSDSWKNNVPTLPGLYQVSIRLHIETLPDSRGQKFLSKGCDFSPIAVSSHFITTVIRTLPFQYPLHPLCPLEFRCIHYYPQFSPSARYPKCQLSCYRFCLVDLIHTPGSLKGKSWLASPMLILFSCYSLRSCNVIYSRIQQPSLRLGCCLFSKFLCDFPVGTYPVNDWYTILVISLSDSSDINY